MLENTAQSLAAAHGPSGRGDGFRIYDGPIQSLVRPFGVVVLQEFGDGMPKASFPEWDEASQALPFQRSEEPLNECIAGWRLQWSTHGDETSSLENVPETLTERAVSVHNQVSAVFEEPMIGVGQIAGLLGHPFRIWVGGDANQMNTARIVMNREESVVCGQRSIALHGFDRREINGGYLFGMGAPTAATH